MIQKIIEELKNIEDKYNVRIIYACESGSRAWGFPSQNSDYDVRFLYVNPIEWYLSITERTDTIEIPFDEILDINGWELRKSLRLLRKSNVPLLEWLSSPIIYKQNEIEMNIYRNIAEMAFLPQSAFHHYLSIAKNKLKQISCEKVKIKDYLYAARTILCCEWIIRHSSQPPMQIQKILSEHFSNENIQSIIYQLIDKRKMSMESDVIERDYVFEHYLNGQINIFEMQSLSNIERVKIEKFDEVFRNILTYYG